MNRSPRCLRIEGLRKRRVQAGSQFELEIPAFQAAPGEFIAVAGESGCGKSTLLDLLALISRPDHCERFELAGPRGVVDIAALWREEREDKLAELRRSTLGYVLQTGGLLPYLSVRNNLRLPCRLIGQPCEDAIERMSQRLGIEDCLDRLPERLSGGQRQRAAILRALIHRPRLVLADEPTAAVDRGRARAIIDELRAIAHAEETAIIMVTHDLELVRNIADHSYGFVLEGAEGNLTRSLCREGGIQ